MSPTEGNPSRAAHWRAVRRLFHHARRLAPTAQRDFLRSQCEGDPGLRREVERLLAADLAASQGFLDNPAVTWVPRELQAGARVGPFRVVSKLGAGNMGEVYRAERVAFRQDVALKVIDASKVDDETIWRFEHERQILARLGHPNIARLIDGGSLDDGRPWFALEYVEGQRIDHYCDAKKLTVRQRVELFRKVCAAVDEAHALAVVHRDLKPANILVTHEGEPKLLDFGIAKILDRGPSDDASPTLPGWTRRQLREDTPSDQTSNPMTPLYASPEQAAPLLRDDGDAAPPPIGVRSDVYSLGVVLYELLTGHPAYSRTRPWPLVLQAVRDEAPRLPSVVVGIERERGSRNPRLLTPESVSEARGTTANRLRKQLRGDLDAILLRCLAKNPDARYASVARLADDLWAFLRGYPVLARRESKVYRARKFLRRRRRPVALMVVLSLFALGYFVSERRLEHRIEQTQQALANLPQTLDQGQTQEEFEATLANLVDAQGESLWLAQEFDKLGEKVEDSGRFAASEHLFQHAVSMFETLEGNDSVALAPLLNNLAGSKGYLGAFEEAEALYERSLALYERHPDHDSVQRSRVLNNLATLYQSWEGRVPEARSLLVRCLAMRRETLPDHAPAVLVVRNNLAYQDLLEGRLEEAHEGFEGVLADLELAELPGDMLRFRQAMVLQHLAATELALGDSSGGLDKAQRALTIFRRQLLHWRVANAETVFGASLASRGRTDEARFFLAEGYAILEEDRGPHSSNTRDARHRYERWAGPTSLEPSPPDSTASGSPSPEPASTP